ncbi:hypothetical protein QJS04_geneDACA011259 [Acorus gramineus]|uniref:DUF4378 domain-containing protein n=1 Tax=Acorus gramineus TaxID=55184 RepID=A0AAV9ANA8_ACOGR|nr:hypothetical protein QJS04_geneDACA011259 [Acorus gramineus]
MAKELHRKYSSGQYKNDHPGCLWGIMHLFDFHHRLHLRKMLPDRRQGFGRNPGGVKFRSMNFTEEELGLINKEANMAVEDKINPGGKKVGKAHMKAIKAEEPSKGHRLKRAPPFSARLRRTDSIHHLECNDYVLPEESAADSEMTVDMYPVDTSSSTSSIHDNPLPPMSPENAIHGNHCQVCGTSKTATHMGDTHIDELGRQILEKQSLLQEKLDEVKDVLLKQKNMDARNTTVRQAKDLLSALELFNANKELFLQILNDPNSALAKYIQGLQASNAESVLTKSGSFPGAGLSSRKNGKFIGFKHKSKGIKHFTVQEMTSENGDEWARDVAPTATDEENEDIMKTDSEDSGFVGTSDFEIKRDKPMVVNRFKDLKERIRQVIKESRKLQHMISRDGTIDKIPYGRSTSLKEVGESPPMDRYDQYGPKSDNRKYAFSQIRRSRSLTESMDRYSQLIESTFRREGLKPPSDRSKSFQEGRGPQEKGPLRSFGRILSLPEFESYFPSQDVETEVPHDAHDSQTSSINHEDSNAADGSHPNEQTSVENPSDVDQSKEKDMFVNWESLQYNLRINVSHSSDEAAVPPFLSNDEHGTIERGEDYDDHPLHESENEPVENEVSKPGQPSPISVLDSSLQEELISPVPLLVSKGSELKQRHIHFEEQGNLSDVSNDMEGVVEVDKFPVADERNEYPLFQVDMKDRANFDYVNDILKKSGFYVDGLLDTWHSPNQPMDPSLVEQVEGSPRQLDEDYVTSDHQLLFDLINEVLLEINKNSFGYFSSFSRPMPVGNHVLEEVWAKISQHLSFRPELVPSLDWIVSRDLRGNDGWLNLQSDIESLALELEEWILDDLLDEETIVIVA